MSKATAPLILALESAGSGCSAALARGQQLLAEKALAFTHGHAEQLVPLLATLMEEAGHSWEELEALAVTTGPGSFTGLRVGLATAKGLALGLKKPVFGFSLFEVLAARLDLALREEATLVALVDSRREELYVQWFEAVSGAPLIPPQSLLPEALASALPPGPLLLTGDGLAPALEELLRQRAQDILPASAPYQVKAPDLLRLLTPERLAGSPLPLRPLYIRPADAKPWAQ